MDSDAVEVQLTRIDIRQAVVFVTGPIDVVASREGAASEGS